MLYYFILHSHFYTRPQPLPISFEVGWGNGYVLIPPGHPYYGKDYDSIDAWSHGGLTFASKYKDWGMLKTYEDSGFDFKMDEKLSEKVKKEGYDFLKEYWCIGFDTAHSGDNLITCSKDYVWNETKALHKLCVDKDIKSIRRAKLNKIKYGKK